MGDDRPGWRIHAGLCWFAAGLVACGSFLLGPAKYAAQLSSAPQLLEFERLQNLMLHAAQWLLLPVLAAWAFLGRATGWRLIGAAAALGLFVVQMAVVQPRLDRASAMRILGEDPAPSAWPTLHAAIEVLKIGCLVGAGFSRTPKG
ncbi:MAG: hypothetical protein WHU10_02700 [Fimbriimonadales bacterium]